MGKRKTNKEVDEPTEDPSMTTSVKTTMIRCDADLADKLSTIAKLKKMTVVQVLNWMLRVPAEAEYKRLIIELADQLKESKPK